MTFLRTMRRLVPAILLLALAAVPVHAQSLSSGKQTISVTAALGEAITVFVTSSSITFNLAAGRNSNPGNTAVTATTLWNAHPGRTISTYIYFSNAAVALTNGTTNIPSSAFQVSNNGGGFLPLTNTVAFGGANAGLQLSASRITGSNKTGSDVNNLLFNINLSTIPQLPAGIYTGVVTIRAQAF